MAKREDWIQRVLRAYERVFVGTTTRASEPWLHLDVTMAQCKAMSFLASAGASPISSVADALRIGRPAGSSLIDRLVQQGLVCRTEDSEDRRRTLADLTDQGRELVGELQQWHVRQMQRHLLQMSDVDLAALARGAEALADVMERDSSDQEHRGVSDA